MSVVKRWAIRRKSDGYYIPQPAGRNGRGGSHVEPIDPETSWENVRLFHTEPAAKIALNAWLKGQWVASRGTSYDWYSGDPEYYEETSIHPVPTRDAEDMEVVPVEVHLPGKVKPTWEIVGAVFIGTSLRGHPTDPRHPHFHTEEEIKAGKHMVASRILRMRAYDTFETANSIYVVKSWVTDHARATIPKELVYFDEAGTLCDGQGNRSIFDDIDE